MGHIGSKTKSPDKILEKNRVHCRGYIFSLILMKLGQNVCLNDILSQSCFRGVPKWFMFACMISWTSLKMGHVGSKTMSRGLFLGKHFVRSRDHISSPILINMVRMFASMKSWTTLKMGHVGSKTWSLGQMLQKLCVCFRGYIFSLILMKLGQNVCLNKISS